MKVNQIVSEHKKGVRAKKYTTKAKGTVPVYGPDSKDAKLKPVKPVGTLNEIESVATAVKQNPDGSTVYKDATGAEKTAAAGEIKTGPDGKPTLAVAGITPGEQINITDKVAEAPTDRGPVGGDGTDSLIAAISSDEHLLNDEMGGKSYYVTMQGGKPMVMDTGNTGGSPLGVTSSGEEINPQLIARSTDWSVKSLQVNGKTYPALYSGTRGYRVGKQAYQEIVSGARSGIIGTNSRQPSRLFNPADVDWHGGPKTPGLKEADDVLLGKMLTIAGLR